MASRFNDEANEYLRQHWREYSSRELAEQLDNLFQITVATQTVTDQLRRLGIHRGYAFKAEKSLIGSQLPVGAERIEKGRNVKVKVAQPNVWMPKAAVVMGYDPKEYQAIFLDGNSMNVVSENIVVVPKKIHARLAKNGWLNSSNDVLICSRFNEDYLLEKLARRCVVNGDETCAAIRELLECVDWSDNAEDRNIDLEEIRYSCYHNRTEYEAHEAIVSAIKGTFFDGEIEDYDIWQSIEMDFSANAKKIVSVFCEHIQPVIKNLDVEVNEND